MKLLLCDRFFISLINFIKETLVILIIMTLIFIIQPIASMVCLFVFLFSPFFLHLIKKGSIFALKMEDKNCSIVCHKNFLKKSLDHLRGIKILI